MLAPVGDEIVGHALIDAEFSHLARYRWRLSDRGYVGRHAHGLVLLHREVMGCVRGDGLEVDHRNRNRFDCRRENLRVATRALNAQNLSSRPGSSSRFRGVGWERGKGCWQAYVCVGRKQTKVGYHADEVEAARMAQAARERLMPFAEPDPELARALAAVA